MFNSYRWLACGFLFAWQLSFGQSLFPEPIGKLHKDLRESSGLALVPSGHIAQINDSGNPPCILFTDTTGNLVDVECVSFAKNQDWEELAISGEHLFIGDFGNNSNKRKDLRIYRLGITKGNSLRDAGIIRFSYQNQIGFPPDDANKNFDLEAMIFRNDSLYLFSKNRTAPFTGYTYLYGIPAHPGDYEIAPLDSFKLGNGPMQMSWVSGAAINPSKDVIALLGYGKIWFFHDFPGSHYFKGEFSEFKLKEFSQKEGIEFLNDSVLLITDEKSDLLGGGYIYRLNMPEFPNTQKLALVKVTPNKVFEDTLIVTLDKYVEGNVLWELFNTRGVRVKFGTHKYPFTSPEFVINTEELDPGGYVLNVVIQGEANAFKLKKPYSQ